MMDPIDRTKEFVKGGQYAVALALVENGEQKVGVLGCPNLNLNYGNDVDCGARIDELRRSRFEEVGGRILDHVVGRSRSGRSHPDPLAERSDFGAHD
jgi:3'-phosphoadenosine 5'-phosphosulfate (PAPS) 3'-phosphatase